MSYCTYADVVAHTGTELAQPIVETLIADADRDIRARLKRAGVPAPEASDELTTASIALTASRLVTRLRLDGTRPSSLSVGGLSMSDNNDNLTAQLLAEAERSIAAYVSNSMSTVEPDPTRADADMSGRWR